MIKRRDLFAGSIAALASGLPAVRSQPASRRAAVVIGIDKCDGFPVLSAASLGANDVRVWLENEGYQVHAFIDEGGQRPIRIADIIDTIDSLVRADTLRQLVVYFAGHGLIKNDDEVWMLSKAPGLPGEVVGVNSTARLARQCGIPYVTILADACRSAPQTVSQLQIYPAPIFPNGGANAPSGKVDKLFATQVGHVANEFEIENKYQGVFTATLLNAFVKPDENMIVTSPNSERVIPNRKLEAFLLREVPKLAAAKDFRLKQMPDCDIPSDDSVYIARVASNAVISVGPQPRRPPTLIDINTSELGKILDLTIAGLPTSPLQEEIDRAAEDTGFIRVKDEIKATQDPTDSALWTYLDGNTGFVIAGRNIVEVAVRPGVTANLQNKGSNTAISLAFQGGVSACSTAMRFEDGTGIVLAAFRDFVGTVSTSPLAITQVAYDPNYQVGHQDAFINDLRATAAAVFNYGVLRFRGTQAERQSQAEKFGSQIRVGKGSDPTLGIYAAYAFDEASLPNSVKSVRNFMYEDLRADLFDVAMLAGEAFDNQVVPCCPMLGIGWSYLASSNIKLPEIVTNAQAYLISSPWTYFKTEGIDLIMPAIRAGTLN